jgi:hypothetical protein
MQEKTLEEFWKMLEDCRFIQSTDSITDEVIEIDGGIEDMEAVVRINGEFDKYDIEKFLTNALEKAREEGRKEGVQASIDALPEEMTAKKWSEKVGWSGCCGEEEPQGFNYCLDVIRSSLTGLLKK